MARRTCVRSTAPIYSLTVIIILISAFMLRSMAECPPLGLVTHDDYLVDVGFYYWGPTVGIDECGRFIVAYWAQVQNFEELWSADLVLAKRFLPDGTPWDTDPFFISEHDASFGGPQGHFEPSVAVSRNGDVHLAWISECVNCRWPNCGEEPCEQWPNEGILL